MARWKKPTNDEILKTRRSLAERARSGDLRLPEAVLELRKGIGLTQNEFAAIIGLTRRQIADIERGAANPTFQTLQKVGRLFGFEVGFVPKSASDENAEGADAHTPPSNNLSIATHSKISPLILLAGSEWPLSFERATMDFAAFRLSA